MSRNALLGICLGIALGVVGCQNESTEPAAPTEAPDLAVAATTTHHLRLNPAALPASLRNRIPNSERVIDPEAYKCRQATRVGNWFNSQLNQIPLPVLRTLVLDLGAPDVSLVEAFVFEPRSVLQSEFGYTGEFNSVMQSTETSVKGFWSFSSPDVRLGTMKGAPFLTDIPLVTFIYENFFTDEDEDGKPIPVTHANAVAYATQLHGLVVSTRSLNGGDHPLFSFNAFAIPAIPGFIPNKIVMGDGVLEGYAAAGLGNIAALAPQAVYAHEFGHHIQFKNGYDTENIPGQNKETSAAELTRYTELMADTYSAYYLMHQNLGKTDKQQVRDALRVFFNIGDCAFDDAGHHGTPNQREAAADFGIELASRGGAPLTQQQVHDYFVAKYTDLIAPDRPQATR